MTAASVRHKALVICPQRQMMAEVVPLLASTVPLVPLRKLSTFPDKKQLLEAIAGFDARLCFLDFSSNGAGGFQTLELLQNAAPQILAIALLSANNPELVLNCLRAGAAAFVVHPFTADQIEGAVEAAVRRFPCTTGGQSQARVIGVVPAKGAAGATTVACNLSWQMKRLGVNRVLLSDLDPLTGTVSFLLKLKSTFSFIDILHRAETVDDDVWKQMVAKVGGVDVLLAPERVIDPIGELQSAGTLTEFAGAMYDAVVADVGGPFGRWNLSVAGLCDDLLLVCTNDVQSLHAAQRAVAYFDENGIAPDRIRLVVNRYIKSAGLHSDRISEAIGMEVAQVIPADVESVNRSMMDGKPIAHSTPFGKAVSALAGQLEFAQTKASKPMKTTKKPGVGLLSSLFSRS